MGNVIIGGSYGNQGGFMCRVGNIVSWRNQNIPGATERVGGTNGEACVVQIINEVLSHCNKKITTVAGR